MEDNDVLLDALELGIDGALKIHQAIGNLLKHFVEEQQEENMRLKMRVEELEASLKHELLFTTPLSIKGPKESPEKNIVILSKQRVPRTWSMKSVKWWGVI